MNSVLHLVSGALTLPSNGDRRVGLPWESLSAFARIATELRWINPLAE